MNLVPGHAHVGATSTADEPHQGAQTSRRCCGKAGDGGASASSRSLAHEVVEPQAASAAAGSASWSSSRSGVAPSSPQSPDLDRDRRLVAVLLPARSRTSVAASDATTRTPGCRERGPGQRRPLQQATSFLGVDPPVAAAEQVARNCSAGFDAMRAVTYAVRMASGQGAGPIASPRPEAVARRSRNPELRCGTRRSRRTGVITGDRRVAPHGPHPPAPVSRFQPRRAAPVSLSSST